MTSNGLMKSSLSSVFPVIKAPLIKRKNLRKYSWLPDVFRLKGSIVTRIIGPILTITFFSVFVAYAASEGYHMVQTSGIVPLLSVVVGLLLVFRNGTSYDRYWEGRKSFATLTANIRNLSRQIWINAALPQTDGPPSHSKGKTPTSELTPTQLHERKVEALRLCLSFAFAVKHYLRGEDGVNWEDYHGVLPPSFAHFDELNFTTHRTEVSKSYAATQSCTVSHGRDRESSLSGRTTPDAPKPDATKRVRVKRSKQQISGLTTPLLGGTHRSVDFHPYPDEASLPLPLVIAHELSRSIFHLKREGCLETVGPAGANAMSQLVSGMVEQLTAMERVANTPIPISYGIHLKQCVTLYLFALPLTLVNDMGWATIPIATVVAFTFMGIEGIADEIEMPFGTDDCDLPLGQIFHIPEQKFKLTSHADRYCQDLKEEINYIIERLPEGGEGAYGYDDGEGDD